MIIPLSSRFAEIPQPKSTTNPFVCPDLPLHLRVEVSFENIKQYPPFSFGNASIEEVFEVLRHKKINSWLLTYQETDEICDRVVLYCKKCDKSVAVFHVGYNVLEELKIQHSRNLFVVPEAFTEGVVAKRNKILRTVQTLVKQAFPDCGLLERSYYSELIDPLHRYGMYLIDYIEVWEESKSADSFLEWLGFVQNTEIPLNEVPGCDGLVAQKLLDNERHLNHLPQVIYYSPKEAALNLLRVREGIFSTLRLGQLVETEIKNLIFVVSRNNSIFIDEYKRGRVHHSSLVAGNAVACAGEVTFIKGEVRIITDKSGHYRTSFYMLKKGLEAFKYKGVNLAIVRVIFWNEKVSRDEMICKNALDLLTTPSLFLRDDYYSKFCGVADEVDIPGAFTLSTEEVYVLLNSFPVGSWAVRKSLALKKNLVVRKINETTIIQIEFKSQTLGMWQQYYSKTLWIECKEEM